MRGETYKAIELSVLNVSEMLPKDESVLAILQPIVGPWYDSLENPQRAQEQVLRDLAKSYSLTRYGLDHGASTISGISDYQRCFPIVDYASLAQHFGQVRNGDYRVILSE